MSGAAQLGNLLNVTADLNYYTMLLNQWSAKYESNSEKLEQQNNYYDKWCNAYDDAQDVDKKCQVGTKVYKEKDQVLTNDKAKEYADAKVTKYDESLSLELAELDIEYDTMKTMYEALVTQLQAEKDADKQSTATAMGDTHLLQS